MNRGYEDADGRCFWRVERPQKKGPAPPDLIRTSSGMTDSGDQKKAETSNLGNFVGVIRVLSCIVHASKKLIEIMQSGFKEMSR